MRSNYPYYTKALTAYFQGNRRQFERYRVDKRLSQFEKKLLKIKSLYSKLKWREAKDLVDSMQDSACPFLNGELYFVKSYLYAHDDKYPEAEKFLISALKYLEISGDGKGKFNTLFNLTSYYLMINNFEKAKELIVEIKKYAIVPREFCKIHRLESFYFLQSGEAHESFESIKKALQLSESLNDVEKGVLHTIAADVYFRLGLLTECRSMLEAVKSNKRNHYRGKALFQLKILDVIEHDELFSRITDGIKIKSRYFKKWQVINALQGGDVLQAQKAWDSLRKDSPRSYGDYFKAMNSWENSSMFLACIQHITRNVNNVSRVEVQSPIELTPGSKLEQLYTILINSEFPLRKEDIIEMIWGCTYDPKLDNNFYQLIRQLKEKTDLKITNKNRTYKLKAS